MPNIALLDKAKRKNKCILVWIFPCFPKYVFFHKWRTTIHIRHKCACESVRNDEKWGIILFLSYLSNFLCFYVLETSRTTLIQLLDNLQHIPVTHSIPREHLWKVHTCMYVLDRFIILTCQGIRWIGGKIMEDTTCRYRQNTHSITHIIHPCLIIHLITIF